MTLTEEVKNKIIEILDSQEFKSDLYEGLTEEKRIELGQFYTPGKVCIQMIEYFGCESLAGQTILDPCCGSGNLLIACLIAGADSDKIFGNDYDAVAVELGRKRINRVCDILGKPHIQDWQIHQGNARHKFAVTYFEPDYEEMYYDGCIQKAARQKKLDNEKYDAYTMSTKFKKKYPGEYKKLLDEAMAKAAEKQAEQSNTFNLW